MHEIGRNQSDTLSNRQNNSKGDFAILFIAPYTELRAGDIASLKLKNIHWNTMELSLIQGKTDSILMLPVSKNVLTAIADYILNVSA